MSKKDYESIIERSKDDPLFFSNEILGNETPWQKQVDIMEAVRDYPEVNVMSGHGIGKSWTAARVALWFLYCFKPSIVITTAPTWRQVEKILWQEINRQHRNSKYKLGGTLLQTQLKLSDGWFAIGVSTDQPEAFQGFHSEHVLVVMDEAAGIEANIYEATHGLLTGRVSRCLRIGNPTSTNTEFYNTSKMSHVKTIRISSLDCPNVTENKIIYPRLVTKDWCVQRLEEWGAESPLYKSRVIGEFPLDSEDVLIPLSWCERAVRNDVKGQDQPVTLVAVDVARYGDDETVFIVFRGNKMVDSHSYKGKNLMHTVGKAIDLRKLHSAKAIVVDDTGLGGGVTDRLQEEKENVYPINFAKASNETNFRNLKNEMFWHLREDIRDCVIQIQDVGKLLAQLPLVEYSYSSKGQIEIVSKESLRLRGIKSPDWPDCLAIINHIRRMYSVDMLEGFGGAHGVSGQKREFVGETEYL